MISRRKLASAAALLGAWLFAREAKAQSLGVSLLQPFDIASYFGSTAPSASLVGLRFTACRSIFFPANFANSQATAAVAATASTVFNIDKASAGAVNTWTTIGTVTFGVSGVTGTFASTGGTANTLAAGDVLRVIAPGSPDATLAGVAISLAGTR